MTKKRVRLPEEAAKFLHPLTIARMTNYKVGGIENGEPIAPVFEIHKDRAREQPSQRRNREKKKAGGGR